MTPTWLAACVVVASGSPAGATPGRRVCNERLELRVELGDSLRRVTVEATFRFRLEGAGTVGPAFDFPGVAAPESLEALLDGRPAAVSAQPPGGSGFALQSGRLAAGAHALRVRGPGTANAKAHYTHWGSWHPYLGTRGRPVPITLTVVSPAGYEVVVSGRARGDRREGGRRITEWESGIPQGWMFLSVGDYLHRDLDRPPYRMRVYWPRSHAEFDPDRVGALPFEILSFFSGSFGPTGLDHFQLVEIPEAEVHNFSVNGLVAVSLGSFASIRSNPIYLESLLAHELAHYWWGDLVRSEGPGSRWLTEGFAEYSRDRYEAAHHRERLPWPYRNLVVLRRFAGRLPPALRAEAGVGEGGSGEDEAVFYQKGAFVLHMLDAELGPGRLAPMLAGFARQYRDRTATADDFAALVSREARADYRWFFDQWLDRPTGPRLTISDVAAVPGERGYRLTGRITQDVPAYRLTVRVTAYLDGSDSAGAIVRLDGGETSFAMDVPAAPRRVAIDPEGEVFKWFNRDELPVDFGAIVELVHRAGCVAAEAPPESLQPLRAWLAARFEGAVAAADRCEVRLLVGAAAAAWRTRFLPGVPEPGTGVSQSWVARSEGGPLIGIEGELAAPWSALLLPEAPLTFIALRDGAVIAAHAPGLPRIERAIPAR